MFESPRTSLSTPSILTRMCSCANSSRMPQMHPYLDLRSYCWRPLAKLCSMELLHGSQLLPHTDAFVSKYLVSRILVSKFDPKCMSRLYISNRIGWHCRPAAWSSNVELCQNHVVKTSFYLENSIQRRLHPGLERTSLQLLACWSAF